MTGIDRVELAYLRYLLARPEPLFGLVRSAFGFLVLDRAGAQAVMDRATGAVPLGKADLLGLMAHKQAPQRARAEADARRLCIARCLVPGLARTLRKQLPRGVVYLNVGHANLSGRVMRAVKAVPGARVLTMIHDTIPLDHPEFCRAGLSEVFARKLAAVAMAADLVVHPARATQARTEAHFAQLGRLPAGILAPLGVSVAPAMAPGLVAALPPYFVALGTVEPRKNIGLLVRVWQELQKAGGPVPHLYIIGNRGWADAALYHDLDRLVASGDASLLHTLADGAVTALLQGACALLFPSLAEGYGLPPLEAAAIGVPVLAGNLPVVAETLGDYPVYLDTSDVYAWLEAINHQMREPTPQRDAPGQRFVPPSWADHFETVFGKN
jgi:glycosyltransferase involved in cell wall biosynthesis